MDAQSLFMDRESQIAAIEKTFEASALSTFYLQFDFYRSISKYNLNRII